MNPRRNSQLPHPPTRLIGRVAEIAEARRRLTGRDGGRLLTLTGPPGVGKTSLALAVAHALADEYRFGARLVDLAPIDDPALVDVAIADALGLRRTEGQPPLEQAIRFVRDRQLLLLLDNFEQVADAAPVVAELLAGCPNLAVLVTSRVPLHVRWEVELPIGPLALPDLASPVDPTTVASVVLFAERARAVSRRFALDGEDARRIGEICIALDGLPLAIELAAARTRTLSVGEIYASLVGSETTRPAQRARTAPLELLTGGSRDLPARQRTLRDAIAWSYHLLDPTEQLLLRRLAVFVGGCTFEAVETVCAGSRDTVTALIEHGLIQDERPPARAHDDGPREPRVRLLETVRQFGLEQLVGHGELESLRERHARFFLDLAERAEPELFGPDQARWLERLAQDGDNLRSAERWMVELGGAERALPPGATLIRFWRARGDAADTRERVARMLDLAASGSAPPIPATVRAFEVAGELAASIGDYPGAELLFGRSLSLARQLDDRPGISQALRQLSRLAGHQGRYREAQQLAEESLALQTQDGDRAGLPATLRQLGMVHYFLGDQSTARELIEQALAAAHLAGDQRLLADASLSLALTYHVSGGLDEARRLYESCLATDRAQGHRSSEGAVLNNLGNLLTLRGDLLQARTLLRDGLLASRESGDRRRLGFTLSAVAGLVAAEGEPERAIRFAAAAQADFDAMGTGLDPPMRTLYEGQLAPARAALGLLGVAAAESSGRGMTLEQAVDEALAWLVASTAPPERHREATGPAPADAPVPGERAAATAGTESPGPVSLTPREREVALLLGRGLTTNREIATALNTTEGTAASYVQRVLSRLDLRTRAQVAAWAAAHLRGEVSPGT